MNITTDVNSTTSDRAASAAWLAPALTLHTPHDSRCLDARYWRSSLKHCGAFYDSHFGIRSAIADAAANRRNNSVHTYDYLIVWLINFREIPLLFT